MHLQDFKLVDPLKFYISVGNERVARSRLSTIINSRIRNVLGQEELQTLLSKDRSKQMALIKDGVNNEAQNFGINIVDVRIKRADLPQANSDAIYRRMQIEGILYALFPSKMKNMLKKLELVKIVN